MRRATAGRPLRAGVDRNCQRHMALRSDIIGASWLPYEDWMGEGGSMGRVGCVFSEECWLFAGMDLRRPFTIAINASAVPRT